jgi:hypothetical protein
LLVEADKLIPVEIKSGKTMDNSFFENLKYWYKLGDNPDTQGYVVYGGEKSLKTSTGSFISWRNLDLIHSPS